MKTLIKMLNAEVEVTINGYGLMGILAVSLYGIFYLIKNSIGMFL